MKSGLHVVTSSVGKERAFISPASKNGFKYVMYMPESLEENVKRYAVASDGTILAEFKTPQEILQFKENVNAALGK